MLDANKTEAYVSAAYGEVTCAFVNIGRQNANALFGAIVDVFGNFGVVPHY